MAPTPPAFVVVQDIAATWAAYKSSGLAFGSGPAPGLILHAAGPTADGFRTVDVWESEQSHRRHEGVHGAGHQLGLATPPVIRQLHVEHLLYGTEVGSHSAGPSRRPGRRG